MNKKKICMFFLGFLLAFGLFIPATEARAAEGVAIDETTFPDAVFRQYVLDTIDTDKDEILETEESSIVTDIYVSYESITSLKGVEYFTFLKTLYCGGNQLTSLDVSKNEALSELDCYGNQLTSLDVSKNEALIELKCYGNQLTSLDVSKNVALTNLQCDRNQLTSLDVSKNEALTKLDCYNNQLTSLDVSKNAALTNLSCYGNQLTSLDVSKNEALTDLTCSRNQLTSLDVSKNEMLTYLHCSYNQLTSLDVSKNEMLTYLRCDENQLTSLDVSKNSELTTLYCNSNRRYFCTLVKLTDLPGFDPTKVRKWNGATYDAENGRVPEISARKTTYEYDCGNGYSIRFELFVSHYDEDADGYCDTCTEQTSPVIDETTFPDAAFRQYVLDTIDTDKDGILEIEESSVVTDIFVPGESITSLKGVEYFTFLRTLYCFENQLTSLDVSKNVVLTNLGCHWNQLTSLDVSKNERLRYLSCCGNQLTSLDVSKNTALTELHCYGNQLTSLDVSKNEALLELLCFGNPLTSLDVSKNEALYRLDCYSNQLTSLDVSKNEMLKYLYCENNQLTSLDVSKNESLKVLHCFNNQLASLDVSKNEALTELFCYGNRLTSLDVSKNSMLTLLNCNSNIGRVCPFVKLTDLPGFDPAKASNWNGATYDTESGKLTEITSGAVAYDYDCGNGYSISFVLSVSHFDDDADGYCDIGAERISFEIDETTFPDAAFRQYVLENIDRDKDGILEIEENSMVTYLNVAGEDITSLKGVEYFSFLTQLDCRGNQLTSLDVSKNEALTYLDCSGNPLTSLDVSKNAALTSMFCDDNQLTSLDVSKNEALTYLSCGGNPLTRLDVSKNAALMYLNCFENQLTSLDVSKNEALTTLFCNRNQLLSLDVSKNEALTSLSCGDNQLTSLDVSKNEDLTKLSCEDNQLTSLDVSKNEALTSLACEDNQLTSLDVSKNEALTDLRCSYNQLTSLDVSKNSELRTLLCDSNCGRVCLVEKLTDLPGFDPAKASNWNGATYDAESDKLTDIAKKTVTYKYDCGNGFVRTFKLELAEHVDVDGDGLCETCGKECIPEPTPTPEPSDPIEAFVTRMYQVILEREPDAGSATWVNGLKDGSFTGVRVADGFVLSEEMLNKDISNEEFVKILYRAFFGREADEGGLKTWKDLLDAGCKKQYVFAGFANSGEFGKLCAEAGIVQGRAAEYLADRQTGLSEKDYKLWCFVERMYMAVLERTADLEGVMNWVGLLQAGTKTGIELADGFLMSEEFLAKEMTDEEYVQTLYRAFFNRDADPEGLATWTGALANGWSKKRVFAGFANSNEFTVLCEQAGIVRGTAEEQ